MFLNTFHLSNIYNYVIWNLIATSHTKSHLPGTCFPRVSSRFRTVVSMQHQAESILDLQVHCQEWLEIGSTLSASADRSLTCYT